MASPVLYHNPGCSKSRGALEILRERGIDFEIVEYLEQPPDRTALERILERITDPPADLVRKDKHFDPKSKEDDPTWFLVDVAHVETFAAPLTRDALKDEPALSDMIIEAIGQPSSPSDDVGASTLDDWTRPNVADLPWLEPDRTWIADDSEERT